MLRGIHQYLSDLDDIYLISSNRFCLILDIFFCVAMLKGDFKHTLGIGIERMLSLTKKGCGGMSGISFLYIRNPGLKNDSC